MNTDIHATVVDALLEVAPDIEPATLDGDALLREDLGLDSMDVLNLVVALHEATGIEIPEADYGALTTVEAIAQYLGAHAGASA